MQYTTFYDSKSTWLAVVGTAVSGVAGYYLYKYASQRKVLVENVGSERPSIALGPHKGWVSAVTGLPANDIGAIVASGGYDMSIRMWKLTGVTTEDGHPALEVISGAGCANIVRSLCSFNWDGYPTVITGESAFDGATTQFFDVSTCALVSSVRGHSMAVLDVCYIPATTNSSSRFVSCSPDCSLRLYTIGPRKQDSSTIQQVHVVNYTDRLLSVTAAPRNTQQDGKNAIIVASSIDNSVLLLSDDFSMFQPISKNKEHTGPVTRVRLDPNSSSRLISSGHDGNLILWDLASMQPTATYHIDSSISTMSICNASSLIATGSQDAKVRLWDSRLPADCAARSLDGHSDFVLSVAFSQDGSCVFSGSKDRSLRCWDLRK